MGVMERGQRHQLRENINQQLWRTIVPKTHLTLTTYEVEGLAFPFTDEEIATQRDRVTGSRSTVRQ